MYNLEIMKTAVLDLEEISNYIFQASFNKKISEKIYNEIMATILWLKIFPFSFPIFMDDFRVMTVRKKYRVFYKVNENLKLVTIYYIFWSSENYNKLIK